MNKPLILIGGGGHCKSVIEAAESAGYSILGILDMPEDVGNEVLPGYKVIGTDDDIPTYVDQAEFVITVGFIMNPIIRIKIFNKVKEAGGKLATVVASTALVSKYATIGEGTVVLHHAFVNASAKVGKNVIINTFVINGECKIGERVFVGSQSVLANCITVGEDIIIGAGSVVRKSISKKGIYAGNPAIIKVKTK